MPRNIPALFITLLLSACSARPHTTSTTGFTLDVEGNHAVSDDALLGGLALARASRLDPVHLDADVARIRGVYLRRGHLDVAVEARVAPDAVTFVVVEGPRATIAEVRLSGVPDDLSGTLAPPRIAAGQAFDHEAYAAVRFDGSTDPRLAIRLSREVRDVTLGVAVTGRASDPRVTLTSNPPGHETDDLAVAAGGLTVDAPTRTRTAGVGFGRWITRRAYVAYRRRLDGNEAELEYQVGGGVVVQGTSTLDRGAHGVDVVWVKRW